jgi:hypothetical protein
MRYGLKSSIDPEQLREKLNVTPFPSVLELHLTEHDSDDAIVKTIDTLHQAHPELIIMLHAPMGETWNGSIGIDSTDIHTLRRFARLCKSHLAVMGGVMHTESDRAAFNHDLAVANLALLRREFPEIDELWWFENLPGATATQAGWKAYLEEFDIQRVTIDISHWLATNSLASLEAELTARAQRTQPTYVHISDHIERDGQSRPAHLGEGDVVWERLAPLIAFGVIETFSEPEELGREMKEDYARFLSYLSPEMTISHDAHRF